MGREPAFRWRSEAPLAIISFSNFPKSVATRKEHIITIEDPIEFIFKDKMSLIEQREIGLDAPNFEQALKDGLRADPDVILIGEMRDRETISIAVRAALTGHLVISTLHTINAIQTVNRIVHYFSPEERDMLRDELATALKAVIAQRLIPRSDGKGRVPCVEVMIVNDVVRKLIREGRFEDIEQVIKNGTDGMQSFDMSLVDLVKRGLITFETGLSNAEDKPHFKRLAAGTYAGTDRSGILSGF